MKTLQVLVLGFVLVTSVSLFAVEPVKHACKCKNCKCTPQAHCGCYSDSGCHCAPGKGCKIQEGSCSEPGKCVAK